MNWWNEEVKWTYKSMMCFLVLVIFVSFTGIKVNEFQQFGELSSLIASIVFFVIDVGFIGVFSNSVVRSNMNPCYIEKKEVK